MALRPKAGAAPRLATHGRAALRLATHGRAALRLATHGRAAPVSRQSWLIARNAGATWPANRASEARASA